MALFVDGPACTIDDLLDQDAGLLPIAATTGINVSSKLRLAKEEIQTDLDLWLIKPRTAVETFWGPVLRIEQIVVTSPLKRWEAMHALALVYRDAWFSQFVDRYQGKWQEYSMLARGAREDFVASGLALVNDPVHRPRPPFLSSVTGPQSGGTFYASVAWVNPAGQEGAASVASSVTIPDGHLVTVAAVDAPRNAVGFWLYAGTALDSMFRQNDVALPIGVTYTYIPGQVTQGPLPGNGQKPDCVHPLVRTLPRG